MVVVIVTAVVVKVNVVRARRRDIAKGGRRNVDGRITTVGRRTSRAQ